MLEIDLPLLHDVRVDALTMLARLLLPGGDGPLVESEGGDDGLRRAAVGEQGQHRGDHVVNGPLPVVGGPSGRGEGAATGGALVASIGTAMDLEVALTDHAPCGAVRVVAEVRLRVHRRHAPGVVGRPNLE